jgi:hypothetical protein
LRNYKNNFREKLVKYYESQTCGTGGMNQFSYLQAPNFVYSQDGSPTSYSKVSWGENYVKVITTIALLSIAEKRKVGGHPGLLLIDSPSAQKCLIKTLIAWLKFEEFNYWITILQIIIASRATNVILIILMKIIVNMRLVKIIYGKII